VSGQRSVDGREVGALQRPRAMRGDVQSFDSNASRLRLQDAENHVDGGGLTGPVGTEETDDLPAAHVERNAIYRDDLAIGLAQFPYGENLCCGGLRRGPELVR